MGLSLFVLGIIIGAFIVPGMLADPQATLETGKSIVNSITEIVEMFA